MQTGTIKRFNKIKGYGFIKPDDNETEVFIHFSEIQVTGYKELHEGQRVSYTPVQGEKGEYATKVQIISV